jgi:hypothetical protein
MSTDAVARYGERLRAGSLAKVSTIRDTRSVQSWRRRENTRIRLPSRRQMNRKPSCLISYTHCGPDGTALPSIGSPIIAAMILTPIFVEAISSRGPAASPQKKGAACG